jgi:hypothetical protein
VRLNQVPNLRGEDFPTELSWIQKLFIQLNPFIQSVNQVFDNGIDFSTNIKSVTTSYAISTFQPFSLSWPYGDPDPIDLRVVRASKGSQQTPTILLPAWSYDATQKTIKVSKLLEVTDTGVTPLKGSYQFIIRVSV